MKKTIFSRIYAVVFLNILKSKNTMALWTVSAILKFDKNEWIIEQNKNWFVNIKNSLRHKVGTIVE